jgi:hypothetical protein
MIFTHCKTDIIIGGGLTNAYSSYLIRVRLYITCIRKNCPSIIMPCITFYYYLSL